MKKVRPMVDKDLRDEVVNYCGGGESFNSALRYYAKAKARAEQLASAGRIRLINLKRDNNALKQDIAKLDNDNAELSRRLLNKECETSQQKHDIADLMKSIVSVKKEKVKLEKWSSDVSQHNASLMDEIAGDRWRSIERVRLSLYRGTAIGLIVGLAIGYLFL